MLKNDVENLEKKESLEKNTLNANFGGKCLHL